MRNKAGKYIFIEKSKKKRYQKKQVNGQSRTYDAMVRSEIQKLLRALRTGRNTNPIKAFWGCRCVEVDTLFDGKG